MIYNNDKYVVVYFEDPYTKRIPVQEYVNGLPKKERAKIFKYIEYLRQNNGVLGEPYTRHIKDKIRELRVDFAANHHRVFFFTFIGKNIILLHAFLKHTEKTPESEIVKALNNYYKVIHNRNAYEKQTGN